MSSLPFPLDRQRRRSCYELLAVPNRNRLKESSANLSQVSLALVPKSKGIKAQFLSESEESDESADKISPNKFSTLPLDVPSPHSQLFPESISPPLNLDNLFKMSTEPEQPVISFDIPGKGNVLAEHLNRDDILYLKDKQEEAYKLANKNKKIIEQGKALEKKYYETKKALERMKISQQSSGSSSKQKGTEVVAFAEGVPPNLTVIDDDTGREFLEKDRKSVV